MPQIPTIQNQVRAQRAPEFRRTSVPTAIGEIGEGIGNAVNVAQKIREDEQLRADRAAFMDADRETDTVANDLITAQRTLQGKDAIGSAPKSLQEFDKAANETLNRLTTPRQKDVYRESIANRRSQLQRQLDSHEGVQREAYYAKSREDYKEQAHINAVTVFEDPKAIEGEIAKIDSAIKQTPGLDDEQRKTELGVRRSGVYAGVVDRFLANDRLSEAEKYYKSVKDKVNGDVATRIESRIQAERDRLRAKRDSELANARAEYMVEVQTVEAHARHRVPTQPPSEAKAIALFGPEKGARIYETAKKMAEHSQQSAKYDQMSSAELAKANAQTPPPGSTLADFETSDMARQQRAAVLTARDQDGVAYLRTYSPAVRETFAAFNASPSDTTRSAYLTALKGERARLGMVGDEILSKADESMVVERMTRFDDTQDLQASVAAERARWGNEWPAVFDQVGKDLPPAAYLIGTGISDKAATVLGGTVKLSDKELDARISSGMKRTDVRQAVRDGLADVYASVPVEGTAFMEKVQASTEALAIGYMAQGSGYETAIRAAVRETNQKYTFFNFQKNTYRVPNWLEDGTPINAGAVDDGATVALRDIKIPDKLVPRAATAEQFTYDVKQRGYWVTNEKETGLRLYYDRAPLGDISFTWNQLQAMGIANPIEAPAFEGY